MTRNKFIIELEEFWVKKYGEEWARGTISFEDVMEAVIELRVTNHGIV